MDSLNLKMNICFLSMKLRMATLNEITKAAFKEAAFANI